MKTLTQRQQQLLQFVQDYSAREGFPPTIAEMMQALGVTSPHGVRQQLQALARKQAIELIPNSARGIRLLSGTVSPQSSLSIIGRVAAGQPILAAENISGHCRIDTRIFKGKPDYLLEVRGMSMRDAGILEGDLLAVQRTPEARSGQIVVARIQDEVTVKTLRLHDSTAVLEPANPDFSPIVVDLSRQELYIEGVMVGLIRNRVE